MLLRSVALVQAPRPRSASRVVRAHFVRARIRNQSTTRCNFVGARSPIASPLQALVVLPCAALQLQSRRAALGAFSGVALTPLVASADDGDDKPNLAKIIGKAAGGTGDGTPIGFPNSGYAGQSSKSIGEAFSAATGFDGDIKKLKMPDQFTDKAFKNKGPCTPTAWKQCPNTP